MVLNVIANHSWDGAYTSKSPAERSWTQDSPTESLGFITPLQLPTNTPIIDVGGGSSHLVDALLERKFTNITVLDISSAALAEAKARTNSEIVHWTVADITRWNPPQQFGLWHDRAVFHFLVDSEQQQDYLKTVKHGTQSGSYIVMATFAPDGPEMCSGLPVRRWAADELANFFTKDFSLLKTERNLHTTPWGSTQSFTWLVLRRN
jgi:trans-aconitate methyltransferase